VKVYHVLFIYQYLSLSGYQVLLQQSQVFRIFGNVSDHDPTQPTKKLTVSTQPNPTQPNPWVDPTHKQLWLRYLSYYFCSFFSSLFIAVSVTMH